MTYAQLPWAKELLKLWFVYTLNSWSSWVKNMVVHAGGADAGAPIQWCPLWIGTSISNFRALWHTISRSKNECQSFMIHSFKWRLPFIKIKVFNPKSSEHEVLWQCIVNKKLFLFKSNPAAWLKTKKHEVVETQWIIMIQEASTQTENWSSVIWMCVEKKFSLSQSFNCHAHPIHSWVVNFSSCIKFLPIIIFMLAADDQHDERSKEIGRVLSYFDDGSELGKVFRKT